MSRPAPNIDRQVYPAHIVAVLVGVLADDGTPLAESLRGSGIEPATLHSAATRLSQRQMTAVFRNALALSDDPLLGLRAGARMHIAACGIYGYALLSSPTHAHAIDFAAKYDRVLGQIADMRFSTHGGHATWTLAPALGLDPADPLYRFLLEYKFAGTLTVMKDLYGPAFRFARIRAVYDQPAHAEAYGDGFGCEVLFGQQVNDLSFDAALMAQRMTHADPITNATVRELCDQTLHQLDQGVGMVGTVHAKLVEQPGRFPDISAMAAALRMNARTLRRKLEAEGSSYRQILADVRTRLALSYLRTTDLTNEEIADRLGYSDSASFRQAFARWTQASPGEYRRRAEVRSFG
ncbi:AraC family transcriptional regulator [soil metagenome]